MAGECHFSNYNYNCSLLEPRYISYAQNTPTVKPIRLEETPNGVQIKTSELNYILIF